MKKYYFYALTGAIALAGAVGLSACSSSEDASEPNPLFDGEAVKTQFTIAFPQNVAKTRMTAGTVQNSEAIADFRGMDNIVLYPFAKTAKAKGSTGYEIPITLGSTKLGDAIKLSKMIKPTVGDVNNSIPAGTSGLTANNNSILFNDVTIPVGTGSFLFYGKALDNSTYTDKFYNGSLELINTTLNPETGDADAPNPTNIAFDLVPTYKYIDYMSGSEKRESEVGAALATYLSSIADAGHWAGCADSDNSEEDWYNAALGDLYTNFVSLKAGSSLNVQATVQDLYSTIRNNTDVVSTAIAAAITNATYASADPETGVLTFTAALGNSAATYFPGDVNLPDGAALLAYAPTTHTFTQSTNGSDIFGTIPATDTDPEKNKITNAYADYVYPASLYYYCNSGIGTATSSQADKYVSSTGEPATDVAWANILSNYDAEKQVQSNTRSVAILDPIQYAVGRLDMTVKKLPAATLYDKVGDAYDATAGFEVTGLLIGGQKRVGFDFTTVTTAPELTIYDNITKSRAEETALTVTTESASGLNHTLALETAAETDIYVAVEFLNKGADFVGVDGVVPAGCKFYLVGKLSPKTDVSDEEDPNNKVSGVANTGKKVFKQDYKTIANFSIAQGTAGQVNAKGLGAAYNTIPDLRTPQLELGLSVDLHWETGITFDVEF